MQTLLWLIFIYCGLFVLILVVFFFFVFFLLSLRFGQTPPLAFFRWFTVTSDRNAESCNRIPNNYSNYFHRCCLITPRFWPSKLGSIWNRYLLTMLTWNRRDSTPLSAAPRVPKGDQGWIFGSYKSLSGLPESNFCTCLLIGIILRWGFLIWELIFIYCGLFVLILVVFFFFCGCILFPMPWIYCGGITHSTTLHNTGRHSNTKSV